MSNVDLNQIYRELGLENEQNKVQPKYSLIDPVSGQPVEFDTPEEMNKAVKAMYEQLNTKINELQTANSVKPEATPAAKPANTEDKSGLSPEDQAVFAALSEKDPLKGIEFLFSKTELYKGMKEELQSYRKETEANKSNIVVAQFISSKPEFSPANPNRGAAMAAVGQVLQQMIGNQSPTPVQLDLAMAAAKQYRPDVFAVPQAQPQMAAQPQADPWALPNNDLQQLYQPPQTARKPNNPPVPPQGGSGTGFAGMSEIQLLDAAFQKGGAEEARKVIDRLLAAQG